MKSVETEYIKTTIVFPLNPTGVLLGMKKRGFGEGWWNGFGGKLENDETYEDSAKRETYEEVGIRINRLLHVASLMFYFDNNLRVVSKAYTAKFEGTPVETDEMRPSFFKFDELPYDKMWAADRLWVPKAIGANRTTPLGFVVNFNGDKSFDSISEIDISQIDKWF